MTSVYYEPAADGQWLAAVSGHRMLLLKAGGHPADALWAAIASPSAVQATLDELTRGGVSAAPPFALVEWEAELGTIACTVRAIVRGDVAITVHSAEGAVAADASGASTWLERDFAAATGIEIRAGAARDAAASARVLPLIGGIVVTDRVTIGSIPARDVAGAAAQPHAAEAAGSANAARAAHAVPTGASAVGSPAWPDSEATVGGMTVTGLGDQGLGEQGLSEQGLSDQGTQAAEVALEQPFGETVVRKVEDPAARVENVPASGQADATPPIAESGDHDGHTIASSDIAKLRATRKGRAPQVEAPTPTQPPAPALYLELADGSRETLAQPVLVGRAPSAGKVSGAHIPKLLTVSGTDQDISRNHVRFVVEGGTVVVTDLHSRNGTTATLPGRAPQQLRQGEPTSVIVGTVIDLGGGVTFTVREE